VSAPKSAERVKLSVLFFIVAHALGLWNFNLSGVLRAHGYEQWVIDCVWSTMAIAAIVSPLIVGALADQRFSTEVVLRWLAVGAACCLCVLFWAIHARVHWGWVLAAAQLHALWSAPTFGLTTALVTSRLTDTKREFGPIRAWATIGWMIAGPVISFVLIAEQEVRSGFTAAAIWLVVAAYTFTFKSIPVPAAKANRTWRDMLGLEAWTLLRNPDHRVVFIGAMLLNIPLAVFYQHTPDHFRDLGMQHTAALMSLGQVMEAVGLFGLAWLLGAFRLKWLFLAGIGVAGLRYWLSAMDSVPTLAISITMHGISFTLFYMTAQIYLEQRVPAEMRARAQALLSLLMSGVGNFIGSQGCGWWLRHNMHDGHTDWHTYWLGLSGVIGLIFVWFAISYRGRARA
jgi:nucleoside transporter